MPSWHERASLGGKAQSPSPGAVNSTCCLGPFSTSSLLPAQGGFVLPGTVFSGWQHQTAWGPLRAGNRG